MRHELAQLAGKIDWDFIDGEIAPLYSDSRSLAPTHAGGVPMKLDGITRVRDTMIDIDLRLCSRPKAGRLIFATQRRRT